MLGMNRAIIPRLVKLFSRSWITLRRDPNVTENGLGGFGQAILILINTHTHTHGHTIPLYAPTMQHPTETPLPLTQPCISFLPFCMGEVEVHGGGGVAEAWTWMGWGLGSVWRGMYMGVTFGGIKGHVLARPKHGENVTWDGGGLGLAELV
ncbi:hypothetical protein PIB30_079623 [Stylosanthes scabra]|uniref:Uncharacterized protein n=1 Tax=Stylosanthes scabra TaxID=79078 RepID=A0ABU6ZPS1_9FABA|nr:hypothetical protein [Stylosanthes scabra]